MNEAEWLGCGDPYRLLLALGRRADGRKLRLFACACLRRVVRRDGDLVGVESAEQYADGLASPEQLRRAATLAGPGSLAALADPGDAARNAAWFASLIARQSRYAADENGAQCRLLRCLFGNPYRPVTCDPAWRTWDDGCVPKIARAVYAGRRFEDLPVLGDALLDAGCDEETVLEHCRRPGEHARGCWLLDLLLAKA
jgi:hypothetical protein